MGSVWIAVSVWAILLCCASTATPQAIADDRSPLGTITGTVIDDSGTAIAGAAVTWSAGESTPVAMETATGADGQFSFVRVPIGPFRLTLFSPGFANQTVSGVLPAGGTLTLPPIRLTLAMNAISVEVTPTTEEIAQKQIEEAEQQRVLGVVPNYFVVYLHDAAPLTPKQKLELTRKALLDPVEFGLTAIIAGVQQARNDYSGFGDGASGYAKRYAAMYANLFTRNMIGRVVLPSLMKQDPRYFYKGTGSPLSRVGYAVGTAMVRKGDNGHWQPNYSGILGSLASGALTNFYYPAEDRSARLTVQITAIGLAASAAAHLAQEFLLHRLTTRAGSSAQDPQPASSSDPKR